MAKDTDVDNRANRIAAHAERVQAMERRERLRLAMVKAKKRRTRMTRDEALTRRWIGHWEAKIARLNAMAANIGWSE